MVRTLSFMDEEQLIGPTQAFMIAFDGPSIPEEIRRVIEEVRDNPAAVRLIDVLELHRSQDGVIERQTVEELRPTAAGQDHVLDSLLDRARSRNVTAVSSGLSGPAPDGRGFLFAGDPLPDPRDVVPAGSSAVVLLVEHRWAVPLRDAVLHSSAEPVTDAWLGRAALESVGLIGTGH